MQYFFLYLFLSTIFTTVETQSASPNILWIVTEDISPKLGAYGDTYATTPNLDALAAKSIVFEKAYAPAPICSPARSSLIMGMHATSLGTQHLRTEIDKPDYLKTFPEHLQRKGYFTSNYGKTDFNFDPAGVWTYWEQDLAPWRQREAGQPFFSMINLGMTHEGRGNFRERYEEATQNLPDDLRHDPAKVTVPPYYPDTEESRDLWARYADLITAMDQTVGDILSDLEEDGLLDNTIVFFFSDHGHGMPRYKRWLNETGLHVPLIVHIPEKYQHLSPQQPGERNTDLVSFVDFASTVLNLAEAPLPSYMQGQPFLGRHLPSARSHIFASRSRADDMYEISRAVRNDRYLYVRHYMPQLPYIQQGRIFGNQKESFAMLRKLHESGELPEASERLWHPKPVEELYDLENDPQELNNLANDPDFQAVKQELRQQLHQHILRTRDVGLLSEAEGRMRANAHGVSVYEYAQNEEWYDLPSILNAAEQVGSDNIANLTLLLQNADSGVRYWGAMGLLAAGEAARPASEALLGALTDASPSVQIVAAEALCKLGHCESALPVLARWMTDDRPWLALYACRTVQLLGEKAEPLVPTMQQVIAKNLSDPGGQRKYKDFNFASFIGWTLEEALVNNGVPVTE